jgi:hypothetical protein
MEQAASDELRAQGNEKYTSLHDGLAPLIYANRLQASIELYQRVSVPLTEVTFIQAKIVHVQ